MRRIAIIEEYPISRLRPHPKNYKVHDLDAIARSVEKTQHRTIAVRADDPSNPEKGGTILAGHGVWFAMRDKLKRKTVAASVVECTDEEAEEAILLDNRAHDLGTEDKDRLLELLEPLAERGALSYVGYTQDDLDDLLAVSGRFVVEPDGEFEGDYAETEAETDARRAHAPETQPEAIRQVILVFPEAEDYREFQQNVILLRKQFGLEQGGTTPVVTEAVRRVIGVNV